MHSRHAALPQAIEASQPGAAIARTAPRPADKGALLAYYRATVDDYRAWSPDMNMHFGYWRRGINPLRREAMLDEMNAQVLARLGIAAGARVADLGCGTGATSRHIARHVADAHIDCVTCVHEQIERGLMLGASVAPHEWAAGATLRFHLADYTATGLPGNSYDAVFMLESACHAAGPGKSALMAEALRLLKPCGRLVIADELRRNAEPLPGWLQTLYGSWCRNWAVPELAERGALRTALLRAGFAEPRFEDVTARLAPSALHVPLFASRFALTELWRARGRLAPWRRRHILASFAAFVLGAWFPAFGYFFVTTTKPRAPAVQTAVQTACSSA